MPQKNSVDIIGINAGLLDRFARCGDDQLFKVFLQTAKLRVAASDDGNSGGHNILPDMRIILLMSGPQSIGRNT